MNWTLFILPLQTRACKWLAVEIDNANINFLNGLIKTTGKWKIPIAVIAYEGKHYAIIPKSKLINSLARRYSIKKLSCFIFPFDTNQNVIGTKIRFDEMEEIYGSIKDVYAYAIR